MKDFLSHLASRAVSAQAPITPRVPGRFERDTFSNHAVVELDRDITAESLVTPAIPHSIQPAGPTVATEPPPLGPRIAAPAEEPRVKTRVAVAAPEPMVVKERVIEQRIAERLTEIIAPAITERVVTVQELKQAAPPSRLIPSPAPIIAAQRVPEAPALPTLSVSTPTQASRPPLHPSPLASSPPRGTIAPRESPPVSLPSTRATAESSPTIRISIGRVEVRAVLPPAAPAPTRVVESAARSSTLSLNDYFQQRDGRKGGGA